MADKHSPLLDQFEKAVVDNERAHREYQRWQDMNKGCNRGTTECILCRGVQDKRRAYARTTARLNRLRKHIVNALEYNIQSARDYRMLSRTGGE